VPWKKDGNWRGSPTVQSGRLNYFAGLRFIEEESEAMPLTIREDILRLHQVIAGDVMDQGTAGRYRHNGYAGRFSRLRLRTCQADV
jgi:hypothetical protein